MVTCDRCDGDILVSTADVTVESDLSKEDLKRIQKPDADPFTVIEGEFAVWTPDLDVESRGQFPLLLCRECTAAFVEWIDNPDVIPDTEESYDHSIEWSHVDTD